MAEYIDRQAALEILTQYDRAHIKQKGKPILGIACMVVDIEDIPAADVRPVRRGKWVDHPRWKWIYAECSECEVVSDVKSNFCPNCGADMREES